MGESLVETPAVDAKMDESVKSGPRLDVSVSFGRFENDALSWEKWSSFSPNKYLEEVGTLSTPGSVAQKKAYFEAHYKRIAAKKAEEMEQEKSLNPGTPNFDKSCNDNHVEHPNEDESFSENNVADENQGDVVAKFGSSNDVILGKKIYFEEAHYKKIAAKIAEELKQEKLIKPVTRTHDESCGEDNVKNTSGNDAKFGLSNGEKLVEENGQDTSTTSVTDVTASDEAKDDNATSSEEVEQGECSDGLLRTVSSNENEVASVADCESSTVEKNKSELSGYEVDPTREDAEVETPLKNSRAKMENPSARKKVVDRTSASKKESSKTNPRTSAQKATPMKKEKTVSGTKKMAVSPAVKPSRSSTPTNLKPSSISTPISSSQASKKKVNGSAQLQNKKVLVGESKRAAPTALHMSFSLGSSKSSPVVPVARKSLIMERMGDKDIVKRAFKSFQNRTYGSFLDEKTSTVKQVSSPASDSKLSSIAARKRNEGLKKDVEKMANQSSQSATRSKPLSSGLQKTSPLDRKIATVASPSMGLKSDERAEKRKEFLKKLEAKSIAREAENAQRSEKSKEAREAEMKKLRQSLNFKAKPLPSFYRSQGKSDFEKESVHNGLHHQT